MQHHKSSKFFMRFHYNLLVLLLHNKASVAIKNSAKGEVPKAIIIIVITIANIFQVLHVSRLLQ